MAEWLMRGTVNTFFSGSNPLNTFKLIKQNFFFLYKLNYGF